MVDDDLISVYITTRNRSAMVARAIESVLAQTHRQFEILVFDDASEDDTAEVVGRYIEGPHGVPVRYFRGESPRGAPHGRNICLKHARGRYITGLDDDDVFHPQRLALFLQHHDPAYSCLAAMTRKFSGQMPSPLPPVRARPQVRPITLSQMLYRNELQNQVFIETERLRNIGGFDEQLRALQDRDTWTRVILRYGPAQLINAYTYYIEVSGDRERISTSPQKLEGLRQYVERHGGLMNRDQRRAHMGTLLYLKQDTPRLSQVLSTVSYGNPRPTIRLLLRKFFRIQLPY